MCLLQGLPLIEPLSMSALAINRSLTFRRGSQDRRSVNQGLLAYDHVYRTFSQSGTLQADSRNIVVDPLAHSLDERHVSGAVERDGGVRLNRVVRRHCLGTNTEACPTRDRIKAVPVFVPVFLFRPIEGLIRASWINRHRVC